MSDKEFFYVGFINGFVTGDQSPVGEAFVKCIDEKVPIEQAVAMIDKFSADHPERWSEPVGRAIIESLTVNDGPCPAAKLSK